LPSRSLAARLDLMTLRLFISVVEHGGITRAAQASRASALSMTWTALKAPDLTPAAISTALSFQYSMNPDPHIRPGRAGGSAQTQPNTQTRRRS